MDADVALVQEACDPPSDALKRVDIGPKELWDAAVWNSEWWKGSFPKLSDRQTMVVKLSKRVRRSASEGSTLLTSSRTYLKEESSKTESPSQPNSGKTPPDTFTHLLTQPPWA